MNDEKKDDVACDVLSFEDALRELEEIVTSMERGEVSLDAAVKAFERGTELKTVCQSRLEEARMKVEKIKIPNTGASPQEATAFGDEEV